MDYTKRLQKALDAKRFKLQEHITGVLNRPEIAERPESHDALKAALEAFPAGDVVKVMEAPGTEAQKWAGIASAVGVAGERYDILTQAFKCPAISDEAKAELYEEYKNIIGTLDEAYSEIYKLTGGPLKPRGE